MFSNEENLNQLPVKIYRKSDAAQKLFDGLSLAADVVGSTMGPSGKNVIIRNQETGNLIVTRDGVTVCNSIKLEDKLQDAGAELLKKAAQKTNEIAGDGTTTSSVLTKALVNEGLKLIFAGHDQNDVRDGMNYAVNQIINELENISVKIKSKEDLKKVAKISANGDEEIAEIVSEAVFKSGEDGVINVEEGKSVKTSLEFLEGLRFDCGFLSPYFINDNNRNLVSFENCYILISEEKISSLKQIVPILEEVHKNRWSLLIIAEDIEGDALQGLILNRIKSGLNVAAVKSPYYGKMRSEFLKDLCVITGAELHSEASHGALEKCKSSICGRAKKVTITAKNTTITSISNQELLDERKLNLKESLNDPLLSNDEIKFIKERLAKLSNGVAIIKVGGITDIEAKERMYRIEDAVNATKCAFDAGVLPGGGIAILNASKKVKNENQKYSFGIDAVKKACEAPLRQIVSNAGKSADVVINSCENSIDKNLGFDARNFIFVNMLDGGILDPLNVTKAALSNAASVSNIFLSLDAVMV